MIVRIHMDDQYRLSDDAVAEVDQLDERLMGAINANDQDAFSNALDELLGYVRARGEKVPVDEIISSDIILPSADVTMEEARAILEKDAEMGRAETQTAPPA